MTAPVHSLLSFVIYLTKLAYEMAKLLYRKIIQCRMQHKTDVDERDLDLYLTFFSLQPKGVMW